MSSSTFSAKFWREFTTKPLTKSWSGYLKSETQQWNMDSKSEFTAVMFYWQITDSLTQFWPARQESSAAPWQHEHTLDLLKAEWKGAKKEFYWLCLLLERFSVLIKSVFKGRSASKCLFFHDILIIRDVPVCVIIWNLYKIQEFSVNQTFYDENTCDVACIQC